MGKDNYKEFMDDMIGCLKVDNGKIDDTSYFLGTMLFVGNLEMAGRTLDVVDGQQRLTIKCFFSSDKHEVFDDNGSIEHILPEERGNAALNIGNLILLEYPLNHDADKMEYETKKSIYVKSQYSWVAEFVSQYRTWSVEAIPQRAETMADVYYHKILNRS